MFNIFKKKNNNHKSLKERIKDYNGNYQEDKSEDDIQRERTVETIKRVVKDLGINEIEKLAIYHYSKKLDRELTEQEIDMMNTMLTFGVFHGIEIYKKGMDRWINNEE